MRDIYKAAGRSAVASIKREFTDKRLVNTGRSMRSVKWAAFDDGLSIYWPPHVWALMNGRKPGKRPPFEDILEWVKGKLSPPPGKEWFVADRICSKIARYGTQIYRGDRKGLDVEAALSGSAKMVRDGVAGAYKKKIHHKIIQAWH